jgi:hypothetical protein
VLAGGGVITASEGMSPLPLDEPIALVAVWVTTTVEAYTGVGLMSTVVKYEMEVVLACFVTVEGT